MNISTELRKTMYHNLTTIIGITKVDNYDELIQWADEASRLYGELVKKHLEGITDADLHNQLKNTFIRATQIMPASMIYDIADMLEFIEENPFCKLRPLEGIRN